MSIVVNKARRFLPRRNAHSRILPCYCPCRLCPAFHESAGSTGKPRGPAGTCGSLRRDSGALLEHFQFEMLCISNHTACRFAEKRGFSARFGPDGAVSPPRVLPFSMAKCLKNALRTPFLRRGVPSSFTLRHAVFQKEAARVCRASAEAVGCDFPPPAGAGLSRRKKAPGFSILFSLMRIYGSGPA